MILPLAELLNTEQLETISRLIEDATFQPGAQTAGWHAREVKNNEQMAEGPHLYKINQILQEMLTQNDLFQMAAHPAHVRPFLVSRSQKGGGYGQHVDNAIMYGTHPSRTDISLTVFLSDPQTYEGGDLVIEELAGERRYKLPAGYAVLYPSTTLHRVEPVHKGQRLVACTWVQSRIKHAQQREILFDLDTARRDIFQKEGKSASFDLISKSHANLIRQWAEL